MTITQTRTRKKRNFTNSMAVSHKNKEKIPAKTRTRYGRKVKKPRRYVDEQFSMLGSGKKDYVNQVNFDQYDRSTDRTDRALERMERKKEKMIEKAVKDLDNSTLSLIYFLLLKIFLKFEEKLSSIKI